MRVLVVDEEIPFPPNSGKKIRTFNLLKHLASSHDITFLSYFHNGLKESDIISMHEAGIKTIIVPHQIRKKSGPIFYLALLANVLSKYPYSVSSHYSIKFVKTLQGILSNKKFDLIHCEWTPYAANIQSCSTYPCLVIAHNVEAQIWYRIFQIERNPLKKAYIFLQYKKMESFERKTFSTFPRIVAVSEEDRITIADTVPDQKITVVENGVDLDYFTSESVTEIPNSLVFTGAMDWRPNVDAILFFLDEIWPKVIENFPNATFTIVGRNPVKRLCNRVANLPAVELTGTVDDVRPYVDKASVYVVPLRIGGGSRLKILEALSMQKPVISTTIGAEGLDVIPERDLIIADDSCSFVYAIKRLFSDSHLRQRFGEAGHSLVENKYQWKSLANKLEGAWLAAINDKEISK